MRNRQFTSPRCMVAVLLTVIMLFATGGSLFVLQLDTDCEDHCDDSCENCSDCIFCLPTLHMIAVGQPTNSAVDQRPSLLRIAAPDHLERIFAVNIDHPPQNIA